MSHSKQKPKWGKWVHRASPGVSLVECIILMIVLTITIGAIFTVMHWGNKSYAFAREDMERRLLVFNWCQAFESFYPGVTKNVGEAFAQATAFLEGTWDADRGVAQFKSGSISIDELPAAPGILAIRLQAYGGGGGPAVFVLDRRFNRHSSETVSDDVIGAYDHG